MGWRLKKIWQSSVHKCKAIKLDEITKGISVDRRAEVLRLSLEALWHYEKSRPSYPSFNQRQMSKSLPIHCVPSTALEPITLRSSSTQSLTLIRLLIIPTSNLLLCCYAIGLHHKTVLTATIPLQAVPPTWKKPFPFHLNASSFTSTNSVLSSLSFIQLL